MPHKELLAICSQVTQYVIVDQILHYFFFFPFILSILVALYVLYLNKQRQHFFHQLKLNSAPKKIIRIWSKYQFPAHHFLIIRSSSLTAETIGLLHQKIVLSDRLIDKLSPSELTAVVLHEQYHRRFFHPLIKFITCVIGNIFFFFPVITDLMNFIQLNLEISADRFAIHHQFSHKPLQLALLKLLQNNHLNQKFVTGFAQLGYQARIQSLLHDIKPSFLLGKKSLLTSFASTFFLLSLWFAQISLANTVDKYEIGREIRRNCSFIQCVANCPQSVKLYSEPITFSQ